MASVLPSLALLACPIGMGLMMWFMSHGSRDPDRDSARSLEDLRAEHRRLGAELEQAEERRLRGELEQAERRPSR